ncbi:MAG: ABC transporter ATP-binding protein [Candidatus Thorarchaeota archaeon]
MQEINLELAKGELKAIVGLNGSGKTTLLRLIVGLLRPDSGSIRVLGRELKPSNLWRIRQDIGLLFQNPDDQLFAPTVWEDVAFGPKNQGLSHQDVVQRVERTLEMVGMADYKNRSINELSHGQAKRIALAGILALNPKILLLDEPFSGLDYQMVMRLVEIIRNLRRQDISVMYTTHNRFYYENWAESLMVLHEGRVIFDGRPDVALASQDVVDKIGDWEYLRNVLRNDSKQH